MFIQSEKAFTMLELLIVISVIGLLAGTLLVSFGDTAEQARLSNAQQFADSLRASLQADMVGWWSLDAITDGKTPDNWFDQHDGTVNGNPQVAEGIVNNALDFDGNDYIDCGDHDSLDIGTGSMTVEVWFQTSDTSASGWNNQRPIVSKHQNNSYHLTILDSSGKLDGRIKISGVDEDITSNSAVTDGKWHHGVFVIDRNDDLLKMYIDGVLQSDTEDISAYVGNDMSNSYPLRIGAHLNLSLGYFNGLIDEVRIYNHALVQSQIQQHYAEGLQKHQDLVQK